jgi:hypothetical protein
MTISSPGVTAERSSEDRRPSGADSLGWGTHRLPEGNPFVDDVAPTLHVNRPERRLEDVRRRDRQHGRLGDRRCRDGDRDSGREVAHARRVHQRHAACSIGEHATQSDTDDENAAIRHHDRDGRRAGDERIGEA